LIEKLIIFAGRRNDGSPAAEEYSKKKSTIQITGDDPNGTFSSSPSHRTHPSTAAAVIIGCSVILANQEKKSKTKITPVCQHSGPSAEKCMIILLDYFSILPYTDSKDHMAVAAIAILRQKGKTNLSTGPIYAAFFYFSTARDLLFFSLILMCCN